MANFPSLRPATVSVTPGIALTLVQPGYDGSTTTSTADLVAAGDVLVMTFQGLTETEARSVPTHQQNQQGKPFAFDSTTLATSETPPGFLWTYAKAVEQEDIQAISGSEFYSLTVEFVGAWIRRASTPSASTRIEVRTVPGVALPAGTPSATTTLRVETTAAGMATGTPSQSTFLVLATTPANIKVPTGEDAYFEDVLVLCGFNGLNGSQNFVDEGPLGLTLSAVGNAEISTEQSVFGGSSLKMVQPNTDSAASAVQLPTDSRLIISGEFTLDVRCRLSNAKAHTILGKGSVNQQVGIDSSENNIYMTYPSGQAFQAYYPALNTWLALRYTRVLNAAGTAWVYYYFVNGALIMERDSGLLGSLDFSGGRIGWVAGKGFNGYVDEFRLTKACRGVAAYTVDTSAFPRT